MNMLERLRLSQPSSFLQFVRFQSQKILSPTSLRNSFLPNVQLQRSNISTTSWIAMQRTTVLNKDKAKDDDSGEIDVVHFKVAQTVHGKHPRDSDNKENPESQPIYNATDLSGIQKTHYEPTKMYDRVALLGVKFMRTGFDIASRYKGPGGGMTKRDWLNRCLFLETVAGVPGMVAGMARHLKSLRTMQRDNGWIHTLLEEAENERMHLLIFMKMKDPNFLFRIMVIGAQGVFFNMFFLSYLFSPKTCHRFVGYLEEEAVYTYTCLLKDINDGHLKEWSKEPAPNIAKSYYKLKDDAKVLEVIQCIRADEANHRDVNHTFASLNTKMDPNPFVHKKH